MDRDHSRHDKHHVSYQAALERRVIHIVVFWCLLRCVSLSSRDKDEDEGVPCESEFEKKVSDTRVRALKGRKLPETEGQSLKIVLKKMTAIVVLDFVTLFHMHG